MIHFFLDTNIVIDFLTDRGPLAQSAARLFDYAEKGKVKLYLTAVSYNNTYYIIRKLTSHKEAIKTMKALEELTETVDTTAAAVKSALKSDFKDFEDAIQYFAAKENSMLNGIVTRSVSDFKRSSLAIWTPEQAVNLVEQAEI
jgi:predicted nucleic acid-binding protein